MQDSTTEVNQNTKDMDQIVRDWEKEEKNKKKRIVLLVIALVILLEIAVAVAYFIDMRRMANNAPTLFGTWGRDYQPTVEKEEILSGPENENIDELYLRVLDDLWEKNEGGNTGIKYVSIDLSDAPILLTRDKRAELVKRFAEEHGATGLELSRAELEQQNYIKGERWEDGVLFTVTTKPWDREERVYGGRAIKFDAEMWRSQKSCYTFRDCTAECGTREPWDSYYIGKEEHS